MINLFILAFLLIAANSKDVRISLNAPWPSSTILSEAVEHFRQLEPVLGQRFVERLVELDGDFATPEKEYEAAIAISRDLAGDGATELLKLALSIRSHAPRVVAFHQIAVEHGIDCAAFFEINGQFSCAKDQMASYFAKADKQATPLITVMDTWFVSGEPDVMVIVYGRVGTPEWKALHLAALELANKHSISYTFRHFIKDEQPAIGLSGYGVELAIKNTEYKAQDDSNTKKEVLEDSENLHGINIKLLKEQNPIVVNELNNFQQYLRETEGLIPLKQWQVQDLGFQAAQKIVSTDADNVLATLVDLSQNFPLHAHSLTRETVTNELRGEIADNQEALGKIELAAGDNALYINGIKFEAEELDLFQLLDTLKQEEKLSTGFFNMGLRREYLSILVSLDVSAEETNYGVDDRDAVPFYLNNLDTDKRYRQWGNSVKLMLQPYYPGMIRPIARNFFTLIIVADPQENESRNLLKISEAFLRHEIPLRIGIVFSVSPDKENSGLTDAGVAVLNFFNFVMVDSSTEVALQAVNKMYASIAKSENLTVEHVHLHFKKTFKDADIDEVFGPNSDYDKGRTQGAAFLKRAAIGQAPKVLVNGYPLSDDGITGDKFEETLMMEIMKRTPKIQKSIMDGALKDKTNVQNWLLEQPDIMPRLNKRILKPAVKDSIIDFTDNAPCKARKLNEFLELTSAAKSICVLDKLSYLAKSEEDTVRPVTIWVVGDFETERGRDLAYSHIKHIKHSSNVRIAFLPNPEDLDQACRADSVSSKIFAALRLLPHNQAKQMITKFVKEENQGTTIADLAVGGMDVEKFEKDRALLPLCDHIKMYQNFVNEVAGISAGNAAIIANGVIIGPLENDEALSEDDVVLLEKLLVAKGAKTVASHISNWELDKTKGKASNLVLRMYSLIGRSSSTQKRTWVVLSDDKHSTVSLHADDPLRATIDVVAVIDPLSREAQKLSPILQLLRKSINCDLKLIMNPKSKLSELPLKRFYRYVADFELQFDAAGNIVNRMALFTDLPTKQLFALSVHPPEAWMIEATEAEYDLDNIQLDQVNKNVEAVFELQNILLEGHCFDEVTGGPPRGLQFDIGTLSKPTMYDTIVMANLGYFQLKANPGVWMLQLREGRSRDLYEIRSNVNADGEADGRVRVIIKSFNGKIIRLRVAKREGKEDEKLLESGDENSGIWGSLNSIVGEKHETINVFSLASGHLYERFMRIMILSVMKNTKSPVKFWLLKNYLSPQFKKSLPLLAERYGFNINSSSINGLGGCINRRKSIGLCGAISYVPFCDSRTSMEGFRFWNQGYWKNHLAGRRYHISALYVVDLKKFRMHAAGDRLRGQYQSLSADPNSLSNLDQDLPNNMIHQVRIKSLPQEWLWCETWCDDGSKSSAKTIDLCNNPQTKEPKLESAQRIIPEWVSYDQEIKRVLNLHVDDSSSAGTRDEHNEL
ncbi:unnamed protein product, partial [Mesorhabditis spiculigera]